MLIVLGSNITDFFWQIAEDVCLVKPEAVIYIDTDSGLWKSHLRDAIVGYNVTDILVLGKELGELLGFDGIDTAQPKETTVAGCKVTLYPTYHPTYVQYNSSKLKKFAADINKAWLASIGKTEDSALPTKVIMCTTIPQVRRLIDYVLEVKQCTFDFETTKLTDLGIYDLNFKVTLIAISFQHGSAYTIPLFHFDTPFTESEIMQILQLISDNIWANPEIHKINQNIKFDMNVAARYGFNKFSGRCDCTMVMHSLHDDLTKHGIKEWLPTFFPQFLGWELTVKGQGWDKIPLKTLSDYAGIDADGALRGYTVLTQKLLEDMRVYNLYRNLYAFALKVLFSMEQRGMLIDRDAILGYEVRALELIAQQEAKMNKYVQVHSFNQIELRKVTESKLSELLTKRNTAKGKNLEKVLNSIKDIKSGKVTLYEGINYGSPDQLCKLLYSKQGFGFKVPYDRKSRGQKEATGSDVVKGLGDKTGFIEDLLVLRSLKTIHSKYLKGIRLQLDTNDYVHTTYNQANVKTGRLSSGGKNSGPNLQNIVTHVKIKHPFVEELTALPKKAFKVPAGYTLLNFDFSQAELRMIAELSGEEAMINAYLNDQDVHIETARAILGLSYDEFIKLPDNERDEQRQKGKAANFGLCLDGNTTVVTSDGIKSIKEVLLGDVVLTHRGNWKAVTETQKFNSKVLYEITTRGDRVFRATPDHMMARFFPKANGLSGGMGWVECQDLSVGDYLVPNSFQHRHNKTDYWSENIALIVGWYLSEGTKSKCGIRICQSKKANADVYFKMRETLLPYGFKENKDKFDLGLGGYAQIKRLLKIPTIDNKTHDKCLGINLNVLSYRDKVQLIAGLWDGDGCSHKHITKISSVSLSYISVSKRLIDEMVCILTSLGINTKVYYYPNHKSTYHLNIAGSKSKIKFQDIIPSMKCYRNTYTPNKNFDSEERIVSIKVISGDFDVYDISVADDHSFVANGLVSHNCYMQSAEGFKDYAKSAYGVSLSQKEADIIYSGYFEAYPKLSDYHNIYIAKGRKFGYVRTLFGRRAHYPDITSMDSFKRGNAERELVNMPVQGSNGENTVLALALLEQRLPSACLLLNTVHDSIMVLTPNKLVPYAVKVGIHTCENTPMLRFFGKQMERLKMKCDAQYSLTNWKELKKYDEQAWREAVEAIK